MSRELEPLGAHDDLLVEHGRDGRVVDGFRRIVRVDGGRGRGVEQRANLLVGRLAEPFVPLTHREERRGRLDRDDRVRHRRELAHGLGRGNRYREHHRAGPVGSCDLQRGARRAARRDAVVHHDHGASLERHHRTITAIETNSALELGALACLDCHQLVRRHPGKSHSVGVQHASTVLSDGAHAELGLEGDTKLADDEDVEGHAERARHFERHGHAAPRQAEHDRVFTAERSEAVRERTSCLSPIAET